MAKQRNYSKEADVKAEIKKLLNKHKWFWWMPPMNGYGKVGVSDFNALRNGVFMAIEAKFGNNKPTALQIGYLHSVMVEDGMAFIVNETRMETFAKWLEAFDQAAEMVSRKEHIPPEHGAFMLDAIKQLTTELA